MTTDQPMEPTPGKCNARTRGGGRCRRPAGAGTDHLGVGNCSNHAGATRNGAAHAARELFQRQARELLARLGEPEPLINPVLRLQELAGEADRWLEVCRAQVQALDGDFSVETVMQGEQIRAVVREYTAAIDRLHKIGADLVRLNLEERAQRLDEAQSRLVWQAVDRGLRDGLVGHPELYGAVRESIGRAARRLMDELAPAGQEVA